MRRNTRSLVFWPFARLHFSNFHNYTVGKPFNDRSVKRYMIRLDVRDPQVVGEIEWVSVQIHGQSFMLHQIVSLHNLVEVEGQYSDDIAEDDVSGNAGLSDQYSHFTDSRNIR